jgi:hypothetical protein
MVFVAAAGPSMNILLAMLAAVMFYLVGYLPDAAALFILPMIGPMATPSFGRMNAYGFSRRLRALV